MTSYLPLTKIGSSGFYAPVADSVKPEQVLRLYAKWWKTGAPSESLSLPQPQATAVTLWLRESLAFSHVALPGINRSINLRSAE